MIAQVRLTDETIAMDGKWNIDIEDTNIKHWNGRWNIDIEDTNIKHWNGLWNIDLAMPTKRSSLVQNESGHRDTIASEITFNEAKCYILHSPTKSQQPSHLFTMALCFDPRIVQS